MGFGSKFIDPTGVVDRTIVVELHFANVWLHFVNAHSFSGAADTDNEDDDVDGEDDPVALVIGVCRSTSRSRMVTPARLTRWATIS